MKPDPLPAARGLCDQLEAFCLRLVPELARLYVVAADDLPEPMRPLSTTAAYTGPTLDRHLRSYLGQRWRGRGVAMVLNLATIAEEAAGDFFQEDFADLCRRFAVHELAHIVCRKPPFYEPEPADPAALAAELVELERFAKRTSAQDFAGLPPWTGHGLRFIRAALHLEYRSERLGQRVAASALCGGRRYRLSHPASYAAALGDEPEQLSGLSFAEILAREPPAAFLQVWFDDLSHWTQSSADTLIMEKRSMTEILDKIEAEQDARKQKREADFRRLVGLVVDGGEPAAGEVETILTENGKSPSDLRHAAELLARRRGLRKKRDGLPDVAAEEKRLQELIATADVVLRRAEEKHAEATEPLLSELKRLGARRQDAHAAEAELRRTAPSELQERLREAGAKARAANSQAAEMRRRQEEALAKAKMLEAHAGKENFPREPSLQQAREARARAERWAADAADARTAEAAAHAEEAAILRAMLEP